MEEEIEKEIDENQAIENQVIEKLKKVIKPKSEKQLLHIEKLALAKRGSKYKKIEPEVEQEPEVVPTVIVKVKKEKKVKEPEPVKVKKIKKVIYESESSESEEEEVVEVIKKKKNHKVILKVKAKPQVKAKPKSVKREPQEPVPQQRSSYFNLDIC